MQGHNCMDIHGKPIVIPGHNHTRLQMPQWTNSQLSNKLLVQCSKCHTGTQGQLSNKLLVQCSKCHTGTQAQLSNKLLVQCSKFYTRTQAQLYQQAFNPGYKCRDTIAWISMASHQLYQDTTTPGSKCHKGHMRSYPKSYQFSALNATQGHKPSCTAIPNQRE